VSSDIPFKVTQPSANPVNAGGCAVSRSSSNVCYWHKADILNALTNVRFGSKVAIDQALLTNLDL
jgi:hypothetical protein